MGQLYNLLVLYGNHRLQGGGCELPDYVRMTLAGERIPEPTAEDDDTTDDGRSPGGFVPPMDGDSPSLTDVYSYGSEGMDEALASAADEAERKHLMDTAADVDDSTVEPASEGGDAATLESDAAAARDARPPTADAATMGSVEAGGGGSDVIAEAVKPSWEEDDDDDDNVETAAAASSELPGSAEEEGDRAPRPQAHPLGDAFAAQRVSRSERSRGGPASRQSLSSTASAPVSPVKITKTTEV